MDATSTHGLIILKELEGNAPTHLDPLQQMLEPHIQTLTLFWVALWFATLAFVISKLVREYLQYRRRT
jgi:hypothetical protein